MYTIMYTLFTGNEYKLQWLCRIKCILDNSGLSYILDNQKTIDTAICKIKLYIGKLNKWNTTMQNKRNIAWQTEQCMENRTVLGNRTVQGKQYSAEQTGQCRTI